MTDNTTHGKPTRRLSRRTVLRATAASGIGTLALSSTASAEGAKLAQVNFCGCSEVCVVRENDNGDESFGNNEDDEADSMGPITVIRARETGDGWEFDDVIYSTTGYFCDDSGEDGWKIIGVYTGSEAPFPSNPTCFVCNPNQCARKALDAYLEEALAICVNGDPASFGRFSHSCNGKPYRFYVVRGRCGTPGKDPKGRKKSADEDQNGDTDNGNRGGRKRGKNRGRGNS